MGYFCHPVLQQMECPFNMCMYVQIHFKMQLNIVIPRSLGNLHTFIKSYVIRTWHFLVKSMAFFYIHTHWKNMQTKRTAYWAYSNIFCAFRFASVCVLDEVGLAEDSPKMPLKALHPLHTRGRLHWWRDASSAQKSKIFQLMIVLISIFI
jgi:hypothetical protein